MSRNAPKPIERPSEVIMERKASSEEEHELRKKYVMCPTVGCTEKLVGTWKDYDTGKKRHGLTVYRCPGCGAEFTVNEFKVNAVAVPNLDGTAVIYNKNERRIIAKIPGDTRFIDADDTAYINVPIMLIKDPGTTMAYLTDINGDNFTDEEIIATIESALHRGQLPK